MISRGFGIATVALLAWSAGHLSSVVTFPSPSIGQPLIAAAAQEPGADPDVQAPGKESLTIIWTSGDPEVAHRMVLMYGHASQRFGWFQKVHLIVWGPSARLLAADKDLQAKIAAMQADGIQVEACVVCADSYGVSPKLRELGLEVKPMGPVLTAAARDPNVALLTF